MGQLTNDLAERTKDKACLVTAFDVCNPIDTRTEWLAVFPGMGIGDMLENRCFVLDDGFDLEIVYNGTVIDVTTADDIVIRPADCVLCRIVPAGGGGSSNPLQIIAMVAVTALAIAAPYLVGGAFIQGAVAGSLFSGTVTGWGAMLSAGVMLAGGVLMSSIFPAAGLRSLSSNSLEESATYSFSAQSNPSSPGNVIPIVQGNIVDITPFRLASYISTDGEKQYWNGLYLIGEGVVDEIYDVKIDENPVSNYENVAVTTRTGTMDQEPIPEFTQVVQETAVGVKMTDSWHTITMSGTGISKIGIGLNAQQGFFYANDKGGLDPITVKLEFQCRLYGTSDWLSLAEIELSGARRSALMKYEEYDVERETEPYEVRGRVVSAPSGDRYTKDVWWEYYHEIITDDFHLPGTALLSIWAMPTESLSGSFPTVTCSVKRMQAELPTASGETALRPLSNPAYAILELLLNKRYGCGEPSSNVDLQSFELAADWCDQKKIKGALYLDSSMTFETAAGYWGQLGRCAVDRVGTEIVCVSDRPQDYPDAAFLITSADIHKETFGIDWGNLEDRADGFEISWFDDKRGQQTLFAPGEFFFKDMDRNPSVSSVTLYPCRDEDTAWRAANYMNRCNRYLTRQVTCTIGWKALGDHIRRGSVVQFAVDLLLNTKSGLVKSAAANTVTLNRPVALEPNKAYEIALSHANVMDKRTGREKVEFHPLVAVSEYAETDTLTLATPWETVPVEGCSCAVGPLERSVRWYRIQSITRKSDMSVELSCLEYDEAVYEDEGGTPNTDSAGDWPGVSGLSGTIIDAVEDGLSKKVVSLTWRGYAYGWKIFYKRIGIDSAWTYAGSTNSPSYIVRNLEVGYLYRFAVTPTDNPADGQTIDLDYQLNIQLGLISYVFAGDDAVIITDATGADSAVQAII